MNFVCRYDEQLEDMLDQAYERYIAKKGGSAQQRKRVKLARSNGQAELFEVCNETKLCLPIP